MIAIFFGLVLMGLCLSIAALKAWNNWLTPLLEKYTDLGWESNAMATLLGLAAIGALLVLGGVLWRVYG
jgi:hypothetical protein